MNHEFPDEIDLMKKLDAAIPPYQDKVLASDDPQIAAAQRLAQGPDVRLSNVALNRIEAQLRSRMAELHPVASKPQSSRRGFRPTPWLRYMAAACLVIIMVVSGVAQVSANALPGDNLYSVKRAIETGRLAVVSDDGEPGLRVDLATRRVEEFEKLFLERGRIYPDALEEASDELDRSLQLLGQGFGDQVEISIRIIALTSEQERLINLTLPLTSQDVQQQLDRVASDVVEIQTSALVLSPNTKPEIVPTALPVPTWDISATPSLTVSPTQTPTPSMTVSPTRTPTIVSTQTKTPTTTATPHATKTPKPHSTTASEVIPTISEPDTMPTRTPPGHGATPGLGDNPPGQGGDNPGTGNDGQPPGQDKPDNPNKPNKDK